MSGDSRVHRQRNWRLSELHLRVGLRLERHGLRRVHGRQRGHVLRQHQQHVRVLWHVRLDDADEHDGVQCYEQHRVRVQGRLQPERHGTRRRLVRAVRCRHLRGRRQRELHGLRNKLLCCWRHDLHGVVNVVRRRYVLRFCRHSDSRHSLHALLRGQLPSKLNARQRRHPDIVRQQLHRVELRCGPADHGLHSHSGPRMLNVRCGHVPELAAVRLYNAGMWRAVAYMSDWHVLQRGCDCDGRPNVHPVHSDHVQCERHPLNVWLSYFGSLPITCDVVSRGHVLQPGRLHNV